MGSTNLHEWTRMKKEAADDEDWKREFIAAIGEIDGSRV
jgi:hypothetical protein